MAIVLTTRNRILVLFGCHFQNFEYMGGRPPPPLSNMAAIFFVVSFWNQRWHSGCWVSPLIQEFFSLPLTQSKTKLKFKLRKKKTIWHNLYFSLDQPAAPANGGGKKAFLAWEMIIEFGPETVVIIIINNK